MQTHLKLYIQCYRGEGSMLLDFNWTVSEVMKHIAKHFGYVLEETDKIALFRVWDKKKVDPSVKLYQTPLMPDDLVWFDVADRVK